jgi:hypothetical protein
VDIKQEVGETAGKVWQVLNDEGPQTLAQLKRKLDDSSELLSLAMGWLAREDKVDIIREKRSLRVALK